MTTHQDQPPQSRRALRQERSRAEEIDDSAEADRAPSGRRARAAAPEGLVQVSNTEPTTAEASAAESSSTDAPAAESTVAADGTDAEAAPVLTDSAIPKAFPFADQVEATSDDAGHPGFRLRDFSPELSTARAESQSAHDWTPSGDQSVPLDYQTQGAPAFGYVSPYAEPTADEQPEPAAEPSFDSLFSDLLAPEAVVDGENGDAPESEPSTADAEADTAGEPAVPVGEPIVVAEPVALVAPVEVAPEERTLSRREWRAMRAAQAAAEAEAAGETGDQPAAEAPADEAPADAAPADAAPAEAAPSDAAPAEAAPAESDAPSATPDVELVFQEPEAEHAQQPDEAEHTPEPLDVQPTNTDAVFIPPLIEPVAAPQSALSDAMAEFEALTRSPQEPAAPVVPARERDEQAAASAVPDEPAKPAVENAPFSFLVNPAPADPATPTDATTPGETDSAAYTPPIGHWSRQAELDDENQPFENTLSRDVGGGNVATTTNALVLPMIPQRDDFSSVLNATGEIMVTGTINLPGSVGTTGRDSRHYDDPEVDHLFDAFDNEIPNTDSAPVRAITAVSSHTATRGGIEPGRKQNNRVLTILLVTAGVLAVGVFGLLIAGFVFNIF